MDHVDGADEWHVWNYKSGSVFEFDRGGRLQCGMKIQHAIYACAVEAALGGRTKSGYYFPTGAGLFSSLAVRQTCSHLFHRRAKPAGIDRWIAVELRLDRREHFP